MKCKQTSIELNLYTRWFGFVVQLGIMIMKFQTNNGKAKQTVCIDLNSLLARLAELLRSAFQVLRLGKERASIKSSEDRPLEMQNVCIGLIYIQKLLCSNKMLMLLSS